MPVDENTVTHDVKSFPLIAVALDNVIQIMVWPGGEAPLRGGVDQPLPHQLVEGVEVEVSPVQLDVGFFEGYGSLLHILINPVSDGGSFELLEGGGVFSMAVTDLI